MCSILLSCNLLVTFFFFFFFSYFFSNNIIETAVAHIPLAHLSVELQLREKQLDTFTVRLNKITTYLLQSK